MSTSTGLVAVAVFAAALTACTSTSGPNDAGALAEVRARLNSASAPSLLFSSQQDRRIAFKHIDELYPTRKIEAGDSPYPLRENPLDLSAVTYQFRGSAYTMSDFFAMPYNQGFIVVKAGEVLFERYAEGNDRSTRWISFSVAKSVTSMLIGAAVKDGYISSVDEPVAHYLPRLRGTPYEQATIKNVLQMASGVAWNEDYADPSSDVARAGAANGLELVRYLSRLLREAEPGEVFNYNTGETNLVGEILRAAIGNNASTYLTHRIWQPFGMESDASWLLGRVGGGETGGCCINATLRDYARLGIFAMNNGVLPDGTEVLPAGWMRDSIAPSKGNRGYGYLWWPHGDGSYSAQGIFEQEIYVNPALKLVIAVHSNAPTATGSDYGRHLEALIAAVAAHLRNLRAGGP